MKILAVLVCLGLFGFMLQVEASPTKGKANTLITQGGEDPDPVIRARRDFVKQMMYDSWMDYKRWAWGNNELKPVSQTGQTGGIFGTAEIGATIVDSLDTLYIMELMEEYESGRDWVATKLDFSKENASVSVFETNIRFVGGFLTAYALTSDPIYVIRAYEIAKLLLPAFDTPTGIPWGYVNIKTGEPNMRAAVLAEFGTLHLEFTYLSQVSGDPIFKNKVDAIRNFLKKKVKPSGLYWNFLDPISGNFSQNHVSIGALGDSFYEYLIKAYVQNGDEEALGMYHEAIQGFVENELIRVSSQNHLLYIAESRDDVPQNIVGHLACFAGGMFALGAHVDPNHADAQRDAEIGRNFTNTCHEAYIRTATHIGPEIFRFSNDFEAEAEFDSDKGYVLRPEVVESYLVLYRLTGNPIYREWGWDAAQALERYCKAGPLRGYSGLRNVDTANPIHDDTQQTFFLAETLKYLYLLFSTNDLISLDEWVFNTECHPLPIKGTNPMYNKRVNVNA